ncbi:MAG: universal stress protein [Acinetobacter populi]|jgi:nucleotide-binding universal stress UspA family protein|uniref:universal stress protein n=1 Tax=Acinetobacter populi TaxID=1582270 RepID=UPI0023559455|nr:universal stress protein [Acinetobacter populi]MCH4248299.1 universal stress protein [Acinetobacter populi]
MAYQHILVPVDGSDTSLVAVKQASDLAKAFGSKVTAICVLTLDPFIGVEFINTRDMQDDYLKQARAGIQQILDQAKQQFAQQGIEVDTKIVEGQIIHKEIVNAVEQLHADLLVIGSHGRKGIKKMVLGSVAQSVLGEINIPVLVVRG